MIDLVGVDLPSIDVVWTFRTTYDSRHPHLNPLTSQPAVPLSHQPFDFPSLLPLTLQPLDSEPLTLTTFTLHSLGLATPWLSIFLPLLLNAYHSLTEFCIFLRSPFYGQDCLVWDLVCVDLPSLHMDYTLTPKTPSSGLYCVGRTPSVI